MAYLDPQDAFDHLQGRVFDGIRKHFPVEGKNRSLHLEDLEIRDKLSPDDITAQHEAKVNRETWAVPVYGKFALKDAAGNVLDRRTMRIAEIPKMTRRYSYIVNGQELQVDNQWQLKPGVYTRRRANGELASQFNVASRTSRQFRLVFDPASKIFDMQYGNSRANIPLYPLVKSLGLTDSDLEKSWGKEVLEANKNAPKASTALQTFYKTSKRAAAPDIAAAAQHFKDAMSASALRPDATQVSLGQGFSHVTGDTLRLASQKLMKVQAGAPEDDRDSLVFKDLRGAGDYAYDRIENHARLIKAKTSRPLEHAKTVRDVLKFDLFNQPIREAFTKGNSASRNASQINPAEMISSSFQTTIMGEGGIKSDRSIEDQAKFVNASHLGFLDPIVTPEGQRTGVTLRLPIGLRKVGNEAKVRLYNLRTGKLDEVTAPEFMKSRVVLPDQVKWENGVPKPLQATVRMSGGDNEIRDGKFHDADYVMQHPWQFFSMTSNLIPFMGNTSGNRASMATRHIEQSISLAHRDTPLVQVGTGMAGVPTFEKLIGTTASHTALADGKITEVGAKKIVVEDSTGTKHVTHLYDNYPLNDAKGVMHSTPLEHVKVGATVKKGDVLADTNFTKNGELALGKNLRVGYIPFLNYNFEDGVVISETAAKKLTSEHLHKPSLPVDKTTILDKTKFQLQHVGAFNKEQLGKLDDRGVVRVGQRIQPGDPLVTAMKPFTMKDRTGLTTIRRVLSGAHTDKSLRWDGETDGTVTAVHEGKDGITVHVKTLEPMQVGDKISSRNANKGIVSLILPDVEMPHTKDGKHIEVALNPSGIPGRMNIGQVLETAAGKIAQKTGKPYVVKSFEPNTDYLEQVKADLKKHGLSDTEEVFDPVTKRSMGQVLVGPQHMLKLVHQVDKKISVRSGSSVPGGVAEGYDLNLQPSRGGHTGGQSLGSLGMYALLAHGARHNLREMQTYKSEGPDPQTDPTKKWPSQHAAIWAAIATGTPLPPPKPTFAFHKFTEMLRGAGINVEKDGHNHSMMLTPLTDRHVLAMAKHALPNASELLTTKLDHNGDLVPKPGGLFDPELTGGHGGRQWSRIALAEPLPNPVFEAPIQALTGISAKHFQDIVHGKMFVTPNGQLSTTGQGVTGGHAIKQLLEQIDVKRDLPKALAALDSAKGQQVDKALKKVKYLRALEQAGMKPAEAYVLHNLPILPPVMRAVSMLPSGKLRFGDVNTLYSDFAKVNDKLKDPHLNKHLTDDLKSALRTDFYDGAKAVAGVGKPYADAPHKGLLHQIAGAYPKAGYFQSVLTNRRQDLSMRSTIVPEPSLSLDEVGVPREAALDLFRPFITQKLKQMGAISNELEAPKLVAKKTPAVWHALDQVMKERPVLIKRDPALHKFNVQGFRARPVAGNAIQIHPLVVGGFNADFDGDTMSMYVPITAPAVKEAFGMFPSKNLFNEATGKVVYQPTLESALGLYKLSDVGKKTSHAFLSHDAVLEAAKKGTIEMTDQVRIPGGHTTAGRVLLASVLPHPMQKEMLHNLETRIDKKGLSTLFDTLAHEHAPTFGTSANQLKDLGNGASFGIVEIPRADPTQSVNFRSMGKNPVAVHAPKNVIAMGAHSLSLADFEPDHAVRKQVLDPAHAKVDAIRANHKLSKGQQDEAAIAVYEAAEKEMRTLHEAKQDKNPSNLYTMYKAGVKPGWDQYKQMVLAPMIYKDSANRKIPTPVTKSYSEGLDIGSYWTQMHGARRGTVMKVQEVQEPGVISKLMMNGMMHMLVSGHDCGTEKGITLDCHDKDCHDRYLQQPFKQDHFEVPAGTLLSTDILSKIRTAKKDARLVVRSPLKCEEEQGICQKCIGLASNGQHYELGTNLGIQSAQAVGERAVQLTLKSFHEGGVASGGGKALNSFARFDQLMRLPKKIPDEASLAMHSGKIEKIVPTATGVNIFLQGQAHHVGRDRNGDALHTPLLAGTWKAPVVGQHVEAGEFLSDPNRTILNPMHLFAATNSMEKVQNHMANEIHQLYEGEGVKRRAIETVVKAMSNLTYIEHAGGHPDVLRGEFRPFTVVNRMNKELAKEDKELIEHAPVLKGITVVPKEIHEDWMAKLQHTNLRATLLEAAATRGISNLHGAHPIPGVAFGSEFGLSSKDSLVPGQQHLKNVPDYKY